MISGSCLKKNYMLKLDILENAQLNFEFGDI